MADLVRVALTPQRYLGFSDLKHSFAAGFSERSCWRLPDCVFDFLAWGGPEGHHNIVNMYTSVARWIGAAVS